MKIEHITEAGHNTGNIYGSPANLESGVDRGAGAAPRGVPADATHHQTETGRCVVGGAHAFVLKISRIFGLAPLSFESREFGFAVTISSASCVYSYVIITVLVVGTVYGLVAEIRAGVELSVRMTSRMAQVVSACDVLVVVVTAGAGVYGAPTRMRKMLKFMETIANVDASLGAEYSVTSERKLCLVLSLILLFFSVLIGDDFFFYANQAKKNGRQWEVACNYVGFYLLWYIAVLLELQFAFTALSVLARFRTVNDALAHTARHISTPVERLRKSGPMNVLAVRIDPTPTSHGIRLLLEPLPKPPEATIIIRKSMGVSKLAVTPCEAVRQLAGLHGALCDVVKLLGSSYDLPLMVILLSTLLHLIVTPYFLIAELMVSSQRVHFIVLQFLWCATHFIRMFVIVEPCHYTINEGKRTEKLVCRLMTCAPSGGMLPARLELFSRQLMLRSVHYAPLGICTLGRPLIASILGAVTTYLVILIQFQRYER